MRGCDIFEMLPAVYQPEVSSAKLGCNIFEKLPQVDRAEVPSTKLREQIMNVFKILDKDRDGQLSKAELKAAFAKLGAKCTSVRAWLSLWHADDNGDGFISIDNELGKLVDYALKVGYTLN